jgi:hypothetical protein
MRISTIQIKAAFLLFVFSLSTLVSFACAAGLKMGFNQDHHKVLLQSSISEESGSKHNHASRGHNLVANGLGKDELAHHGKNNAQATESTKDDCCRDEAAKFEKCDKRTPQPIIYSFQALFITLAVNSYFKSDALVSILTKPDNRYFIRNHHPPIADTRIAIQSFLI